MQAKWMAQVIIKYFQPFSFAKYQRTYNSSTSWWLWNISLQFELYDPSVTFNPSMFCILIRGSSDHILWPQGMISPSFTGFMVSLWSRVLLTKCGSHETTIKQQIPQNGPTQVGNKTTLPCFLELKAGVFSSIPTISF